MYRVGDDISRIHMVAEPTPAGDVPKHRTRFSTHSTPSTQLSSQNYNQTPSHQPPSPSTDVLNNQVKENPRNPKGWRWLIDWAENLSDIEKLRAAFNVLLQVYPRHQGISFFDFLLSKSLSRLCKFGLEHVHGLYIYLQLNSAVA